MKHTIVTPTYNRKQLLMVLYSKIVDMKYPREDFEWIIIDDSSSDDTESFIRNIIREGKVNIIYLKNEKRLGITNSVNKGYKNAHGDYITRIDSDDYLLEDSLKKMDSFIAKYNINHSESICGVVGLCKNKNDGKVRGTFFPNDEIVSTGYHLSKKYKVYGDRNYCIKREILLDAMLPEKYDTYYVPEAAFWRKIDSSYKTLFVNSFFSCTSYHAEGSYVDKMASKNKPIDIILGDYYGLSYLLKYCLKMTSIKERIVSIVKINVYLLCFKKYKVPFERIELTKRMKFLKVLLFLPSFLAYLFYIKNKTIVRR